MFVAIVDNSFLLHGNGTLMGTSCTNLKKKKELFLAQNL